MRRRTREEIRGSNPRYWEDVAVGDELTPVIRGPINEIERDAWMAAGTRIRCRTVSIAYSGR